MDPGQDPVLLPGASGVMKDCGIADVGERVDDGRQPFTGMHAPHRVVTIVEGDVPLRGEQGSCGVHVARRQACGKPPQQERGTIHVVASRFGSSGVHTTVEAKPAQPLNGAWAAADDIGRAPLAYPENAADHRRTGTVPPP